MQGRGYGEIGWDPRRYACGWRSRSHCVRGSWNSDVARGGWGSLGCSLSTASTSLNLSVGCTVDVDQFMGSSSLRVPVPAPEGRSGLAPELALVYQSGAGNSPFGAGWALGGLPAVGMDTRYHVPRWDGTDGYQLGGDELVPWAEQDGGDWVPRSFTRDGYAVSLFRSRRGSGKTRVERWVDRATGRVHFRSRDVRNRLTIYGARPNAAARLSDPGDESRTLAWLPELVLEPTGNALLIEYAAETADNVDRLPAYERALPPLAQRYLKRIRYGNSIPLAPTSTRCGRRPGRPDPLGVPARRRLRRPRRSRSPRRRAGPAVAGPHGPLLDVLQRLRDPHLPTGAGASSRSTICRSSGPSRCWSRASVSSITRIPPARPSRRSCAPVTAATTASPVRRRFRRCA